MKCSEIFPLSTSLGIEHVVRSKHPTTRQSGHQLLSAYDDQASDGRTCNTAGYAALGTPSSAGRTFTMSG